MRYFYRIYGEINLADISPIGEVNKIMNDFGFSEELEVWSDYHYDLSAIRELSSPELEILKEAANVKNFKFSRVEYLGMRKEEEKD